MKKLIYWSARILSIIFIIFISIFAFDVFNEPQWFLALIMHFLPSFVLIALTIIAWKHERIGSFLFFIFSLLSIFCFRSTIISIPSFVVSVLFWSSWKIKK